MLAFSSLIAYFMLKREGLLYLGPLRDLFLFFYSGLYKPSRLIVFFIYYYILDIFILFRSGFSPLVKNKPSRYSYFIVLTGFLSDIMCHHVAPSWCHINSSYFLSVSRFESFPAFLRCLVAPQQAFLQNPP